MGQAPIKGRKIRQDLLSKRTYNLIATLKLYMYNINNTYISYIGIHTPDYKNKYYKIGIFAIVNFFIYLF